MALTPDQLRAQAEKRAMASSRTGILNSPVTNEQLIEGAQQELQNQQEIQNVVDLESQKKLEEKSVMENLGLLPKTEPQRGPSDLGTNVSPDSFQFSGNNDTSKAQDQSIVKPIISNAPEIISEQQGASDKLMTQIDSEVSKLEERRAQKEKEYKENERIAQAKLADLDKQIGDFKLDNRSLWDKSSTGQKVALMIGGFLSSLNDQSAQSFREGIEKAINRDLASQNEKLKTLKEGRAGQENLLSQLRKQFGDDEMANLAFQRQVYTGIGVKLKSVADTAQSKLMADKASMGAQEALMMAKLKEQELKKGAAQKGLANSIPGWEGTISDATERRKFVSGSQAASTIKDQLQTLRKITATTGKSFSPTKKAEAEAAIAAITTELKDFKQMGTLDAGVERLIDKMIQNPTDLLSLDSSSLAKINSFEKYIDSGINKAAQLNGLKRIGSNIGRNK